MKAEVHLVFEDNSLDRTEIVEVTCPTDLSYQAETIFRENWENGCVWYSHNYVQS